MNPALKYEIRSLPKSDINTIKQKHKSSASLLVTFTSMDDTHRNLHTFRKDIGPMDPGRDNNVQTRLVLCLHHELPGCRSDTAFSDCIQQEV